MINEQKRQVFEEEAGKRMAVLQADNPDCSFSVVVYDSGIREGEVVVQKEKPRGEITDYVIGSANEL